MGSLLQERVSGQFPFYYLVGVGIAFGGIFFLFLGGIERTYEVLYLGAQLWDKGDFFFVVFMISNLMQNYYFSFS